MNDRGFERARAAYERAEPEYVDEDDKEGACASCGGDSYPCECDECDECGDRGHRDHEEHIANLRDEAADQARELAREARYE